MTDNDLMTDILDSLVNAVTGLGFERARDAIRAYGDDGEEPRHHPLITQAVRQADASPPAPPIAAS